MKIYPELNQMLRRGASIEGIRKQNESGIIVGMCLFVGAMVLTIGLIIGTN